MLQSGCADTSLRFRLRGDGGAGFADKQRRSGADFAQDPGRLRRGGRAAARRRKRRSREARAGFADRRRRSRADFAPTILGGVQVSTGTWRRDKRADAPDILKTGNL